MLRSAALPFFLTRGRDEMTAVTVITTRETVHGLLRLHGDSLTIQWRLATKTERVGWKVEKSHEVGAVTLGGAAPQSAGSTGVGISYQISTS